MTFDLEAAREIALDPNFYGNAPYLAANLNAALDEVERLRKYCILTPDGKIFVPEGHPELVRLRKENDAQAKRIAELEEASAFECRGLYEQIAKQRAALKKLGYKYRERGKALVEERAKLFHHFGDVELDPPSDIDCKFARDQLHREGIL